MKRLLIDLGHGGSDCGAVGQNKTYESNIVLNIGKELKELLKNTNLEIKFTRLSNTYLSLNERVKLANDFKADYFLSIHVNAAKDKSVRGVEVWQYSDNNKKLNNFSSNLCKDVSEILNIRNRGLKISKELYVLRNTKMPACLIEVDFISNIQTEKDLNSNNNIKYISLSIKNNLVELFDLKANERLYKVCIGAYRERNNAMEQVKLAKERGFKDTYINY